MAGDRIVHIVEDDAAVRRSLERLLYSAGFTTYGYPSALALLAAAPHLSEGCILLDIWTPGLDGIELQARLRAMGIAFPIVTMTGQGDIATAIRAIKGGAIDFIEKPFDDGIAAGDRGSVRC